MSLVSEPQAATTRKPDPYLRGNYAPIDFETTAFALRTTGAIPADLNGRLLRIGPNPTTRTEADHAHWFTGLGMVHGVNLSKVERSGIGVATSAPVRPLVTSDSNLRPDRSAETTVP